MQFYKNYKEHTTCRGQGPIKIRFCSLFDKNNEVLGMTDISNHKYLIDDSGNGNIYHYDNFFKTRPTKGIWEEKLTEISPRIIGYLDEDGIIRWRLDRPMTGEIMKLQEFYKKAPRDWVDAVWILPNDRTAGPFFYHRDGWSDTEISTRFLNGIYLQAMPKLPCHNNNNEIIIIVRNFDDSNNANDNMNVSTLKKIQIKKEHLWKNE